MKPLGDIILFYIVSILGSTCEWITLLHRINLIMYNGFMMLELCEKCGFNIDKLVCLDFFLFFMNVNSHCIPNPSCPKTNISIYSMMISRIMLNLCDPSSIEHRITSAPTQPTHPIIFASPVDDIADQDLQQVY